MKYGRLSVLFDIYKFSLGAIAYCLVRMQEWFDDHGDNASSELAQAAKEKQERAQQLQYDWEKQKQQGTVRSEGASALDNQIDKLLSNFAQTVEGFAALKAETEVSRLAEELHSELFPSGVYHITSKSFDEQYSTVNVLVGRLKNDYAEHVQALQLEASVQQLAELNEEFGEKLDPTARDVEYDEVEAARIEAEEAFFRVIGRVVSQYGDDLETFNEIMEPVAEQTDWARRHFQRRGTVPEVDPETGEPIDPTDETDGEAQGSDGSDPNNES